MMTLVMLAALTTTMTSNSVQAATKARTTLTIQAEGVDLFGKVKSSKLGCLGDRTVKVYKQKGAAQSPSTDPVIASDTSERVGASTASGLWVRRGWRASSTPRPAPPSRAPATRAPRSWPAAKQAIVNGAPDNSSGALFHALSSADRTTTRWTAAWAAIALPATRATTRSKPATAGPTPSPVAPGRTA